MWRFMSVCQRRKPLPAESLRRLSGIYEPEENISGLKVCAASSGLAGFQLRLLFCHESLNWGPEADQSLRRVCSPCWVSASPQDNGESVI